MIGVGFGRTGTASLKMALEQLGFGPCYHMFELVERPERARAWAAAADGGPVVWDEIFAGYGSTVDWPGAAFWRQLVDHYPDAKVVLTVRDSAAWYESTASTIHRATLRTSGRAARVSAWLPFGPRRLLRDFAPVVRRIVWDGVFDGRFADRRHAIEVFERHADEVRASVPAERLLVYEVSEGWEPLCAFLGVPRPDTPFPWVNDAASFRRRQRVQMARGLAASTALAVAAAAGAFVAARAIGRARRGLKL